ncbi:MAG: radical SAM protein [Chloroflexi bacterium]|nr:radical SAM protein [Chloroflexota bacterium]
MSNVVFVEDVLATAVDVTIDPDCLTIRRDNFPDEIAFHAPGLRRYKTAEYDEHDAAEFISVSITGTACALSCDHCNMQVLRGMTDLRRFDGSLFDLCAELAERGARGVLISGGSDQYGRVPLLSHIPDLIRVRHELGMKIRVHPGLPSEETCAGLGEVGIDGAMIDIIGHKDTIHDVYHLDSTPDDYEDVLARLERHGIPTVPHIILGLHYGRMLGEWQALEMIARHPPKLLVLVILMPLSGTSMAVTKPPSLAEIGGFFETTRKTMPQTPVMLGCARPLGLMKRDIDRLAIDAGLNGIAYPADGIVEHARQRGLQPNFINACCGVTW